MSVCTTFTTRTSFLNSKWSYLHWWRYSWSPKDGHHAMTLHSVSQSVSIQKLGLDIREFPLVPVEPWSHAGSSSFMLHNHRLIHQLTDEERLCRWTTWRFLLHDTLLIPPYPDRLFPQLPLSLRPSSYTISQHSCSPFWLFDCSLEDIRVSW